MAGEPIKGRPSLGRRRSNPLLWSKVKADLVPTGRREADPVSSKRGEVGEPTRSLEKRRGMVPTRSPEKERGEPTRFLEKERGGADPVSREGEKGGADPVSL